MQPYDAIRSRYGFDLPDSYRTLQRAGHFDMPMEKYLEFYDCEWLSLEAIAEFKFNPWEVASDGGFVPFAITGRHEPYCWRLDWASGGEPPIVLCERSEHALCLAPDFRGILYRMVLEAYAGRNDCRGDATIDALRRAAEVISPLLPEPWLRRLQDLRERVWLEDDNLCVIAQQECDAIIAQDLAFPHLNERFIHDKEYLERMKRKS